MNNHRSEKDLLKRTAKLEKVLAAKNHELEIEAALEKVRIVAMGMNQPADLLDVCKTLYKQFLSLGFGEIRNAMINIHNDADESFINYDYSDEIGKSTHHLAYDIHPLVKRQIKKIRSARDAFSETYFAGNDLAEWKRFRKKVGEKDDPRLTKNKALYYYLYSIGIGSIGISTFGKISEEKKAVLKRFRNVFDLSYQRYVDIARAEAQAREAKIEAALEKIRGRSLAMHQSKELKDAISVTFEKLNELKVLRGTVAIQLFDRKTKNSVMWVGNNIQEPQMVNLPYDKKMMLENTYLKDGWDAMMSGVDIINKEYSFVEKNKFFKYIFSRNDLTQIPQNAREVLRQIKKYRVCLFTEKNSALFVDSFSGESFSKEDLNIVKRTGKVFEQAYIRFLDLQKAEAQAREAQIEAALERVRSRAMAMQTSEELNALIGTVFTELTKLDLVLTRCVILIYEDNEKGVRWWMANSEAPSMPMDFFVKYADMPFFNEYLKGWQERSLKWQYVLEGENKFNTDEFLFRETQLSQLPDFVIAGMRAPDRVYLNASFNNFGNLTLASLEPLSDEHFDILLRFAKVFDLTYTRFNDLQKAEAQAREAQIETALERVRSRTMAMHQTSELQEVIHTVHNELLNLHLSIDGGSFVVINDDIEPELRCWGSGGTANTSEEVRVPHFNMPFCTNLIKGIKRGPGFFTEEFSNKDKKKYFTKLFKHKPWSDLNSERKKATLSSLGGYTRSVAVSKHTTIFIINHQGRKFTEAENDILKRFSKVFEQAYTRFLDLQKAEAQARESQIQLALERVRARTMAMQHSNELGEAASLLFKQISDLGIQTWTSGFNIWQSDGNSFIGYNPTPSGGIAAPYIIPSKEDNFFKKIYQAKKAGEDFIVFEWKEGPLAETYSYMKTLPIVKEVLKGIELSGFQLPTFQINHCVFFAQGFLLFITLEPYPEAHDIFKRFGRVFEQTYTRFLDLQKAEAQAKESQIQLALERVRARTMAMQKSDELTEVAALLFQQVKSLGVSQWVCGFSIWEIGDTESTWYSGSPDGKINPPAKFPLTEHPVFIAIDESRRRGDELFIYEKSGEIQADHYRYMMSIPVLSDLMQNMFDAGLNIPSFQIDHIANFSHGNLIFITYEHVPEMHDVFKRFAKVFEQTYTRFLDLQKAEEQAREAKIEASLERIRARAMAMHKTDELLDVGELLYKELTGLGIKSLSVTYSIMADDEQSAFYYGINPVDGKVGAKPFVFPHTETEVMREILLAWQRQEPIHSIELDETGTLKHQTYVGEHILAGIIRNKLDMPFSVEAFLAVSPKKAFISTFNFKHGYLFIIGDVRLSNDQQQILLRFTKVFELTYRRFLDLQQAEAQARESQIQLALERVRASTMAMHRSEDLAGTAQILFQQLQELGEIPDRMSIGIVDEAAGVVNFWSTDQLGSHINNSFEARLNERTVISKTYKAWKEHKKSLVIELHGQELKEWIRFAREEMNIAVKDDFIKDRRVHNLAFFSHGWLLVTTHELQSSETIQILERFASVFNLTYRRFLDLQKAEAQAREAQIEAALERVRSRSMAMHQSSDLHEVVKVVTEQLTGLGIKFNAANFARIHSGGSWDLWISAPEQSYPAVLEVPYIDHGLFNNIIEAVRKGQDFLADAYDQEEKNIFFKHFFENTLAKHTPDARKEWVMACKGFARSVFLTKNIWLAVSNYDGIPFSNENNAIFKRFANAFEQTYTRFLDLQKAEANARESQIEASLERVRSKTMAMHNSNDVANTVSIMFDEVTKLGVQTIRCGIGIMHDDYNMELWTAKPDASGKVELIVGHIDMKLHPLLKGGYESWQNQAGGFTYELKDDDLIAYFNLINNSRSYPAKYDIASLPSEIFHYEFHFKEGTVFAFSIKQLSAEASQIFKRFASVFGQTYRRYLDLQRAEAQAREAQIEAALERVRAKAMAMHSSQDLVDTIQVFYRELKSLSVTPRRCGVALMDKEKKLAELTTMNTTEEGDSIEVVGQIKMYGHPVLDGVFENWLMQKEYHAVLRGNEIKEYYKVLRPQISIPDYPHDMVQHGYYFMFKEGDVYAWTDSELPEEHLKIYRRFASVISLTYKRYLDLKQAEAQAKEAQIEAGLERVRARTMAMHTSDDVSAATATMFTELEKLGIENFRGGITNMLPNRTQHVWSVNNLPEGKVVKAVGEFNIDDHPFWQLMYKKWQEKNDFTHYFLAGQEKEDYVKILNSTQGYLTRAIENFPDVHFQVYFFNEGGVWTNSLHAHTDEEQQIMKRFTSVFSLTFRRYQDLRKAEAQAREATIEAALEKVRGKAMAMHNSNDLSATASMVFTELRKLGINPIRCGVGLLNKESRKAQLYSATSSADSDSLSLVGWVILSEHPVLEKIYDTWLNNEEYYPELQGEQMRLYYEQLLKGLPVTAPTIEADKKQYGHFIPFSVGCLYAWSETAYNETEIKILRRFATIIDLTFRRYMELQHSEANAREAMKQAALDRIRADIASMRKVDDLDRITPLIWNELTILGLPFIRCGIFLMDDSQRLIHTFLSTPEGKAIAAFHLPYDTERFDEVVDNWRHKRIYVNHWTEPDYIRTADTLIKQGAIADREQYIGSLPIGGFYLHFIPFLQGMLYVGNIDELGGEEISLIESVADAFSTAYARYEDFNRLEAAKQQVEKTLTDLKQAQTQLVQSEKMASLGELTAGIAHEIQNPLNFVNNFSDVSNELLDEMKTELAKGNIGDAMAIAEDVKLNLEKINHHGKRADGIVKGMLQHSRTSSGQKELTDINALADEYLRLAFHGLRAKDKSFNAKFETHFDENVGKIDIIQQDIGRVILNLINNAFYAVSEKKKHAPNGYEPTVTLTTIKDNGKIEVKVKDNGNGVPISIVDKIFQPFFTTKPTGQGTGLGLSLAYDIVKAHGGEVKVESKEGEGSEFIIQLPIV